MCPLHCSKDSIPVCDSSQISKMSELCPIEKTCASSARVSVLLGELLADFLPDLLADLLISASDESSSGSGSLSVRCKS